MTSDIEIIFGSNRCINTNGIIEIENKEFFKLELIPYKKVYKPLISVDIRDKDDKLLGKVYRSTSFVHIDEEYESSITAIRGELKRMELKRKNSNEILFQLIFHRPNIIEINGIFYNKNIPYPIIATENFLDLNTNKLIHSIINKNGTAIRITKDSISI